MYHDTTYDGIHNKKDRYISKSPQLEYGISFIRYGYSQTIEIQIYCLNVFEIKQTKGSRNGFLFLREKYLSLTMIIYCLGTKNIKVNTSN